MGTTTNASVIFILGINILDSDIPTMVSTMLASMKPAGWEDVGKALGLTKTTDLK